MNLFPDIKKLTLSSPLKLEKQMHVKKEMPLDKFIKGPLPYEWFCKLFKIGGKASNIGLAMWYLSGLQKTHTIKLNHNVLTEFGVSAKTSYRLIKRMEEAGLIHIERFIGKSPLITILF